MHLSKKLFLTIPLIAIFHSHVCSASDFEDFTSFCDAVELDNATRIEELLESKANVNATSPLGVSALHIASYGGVVPQ